MAANIWYWLVEYQILGIDPASSGPSCHDRLSMGMKMKKVTRD
jgi:hypothetical protein